MKVGDLVKSLGFGPRGMTGELGLIIKPDTRFPRTWIVCWSNCSTTSYAQDGLGVVSEGR